MSAAKHTPGPWLADLGGPRLGGFSIAAPGESSSLAIAKTQNKGPFTVVARSQATAKANARLIAAAPELLEALKYARRFLNPADHDTAFVDAAIAHATGKTP